MELITGEDRSEPNRTGPNRTEPNWGTVGYRTGEPARERKRWLDGRMAQSRGARLDKTGRDTGPEPIKEDRPNRTEPSRIEPRIEPVDR